MMRIELTGALKLSRQLQLLKLPPAQRRRLNGTLARKVRVYSRKRLRAQRGLNGLAWTGRKSTDTGGENNKKMLRGMSKRLRTDSDSRGALVQFQNRKTGQIAYAHQHGLDERWTAQKAQKVYGKPDYKAPSTRRQARALKQEGYVVRLPGGRKKKPTMRWLTDNLSLGQAGVILRTLRDTPRKNNWVLALPERNFLGTTQQEIEALANTVFDQTLAAMKRG